MKVLFIVTTSLLGIVYCDNGVPHQASKDDEVPQLRAPAPAPVSFQPLQSRPFRPAATFVESVGERPGLHFVQGPQPTTFVQVHKPVVFPVDDQGPIFRPQKFSPPASGGFSPSLFVPVHQVSGPVFLSQRPVPLPARIPLVPHQVVTEVHNNPAPVHSSTVFHDEPLFPVAAHPTAVPVHPLRPPVLLHQTPFVNFQESDNRKPLIPISSNNPLPTFQPQPEVSLPYPITQNPTTNPHSVAPRPPKYTPVPAPIEVPVHPVGDFQFGYDVDFNDKYGGAKYSHNENHNGQAITGKYNVNLPGGSFQSVSYTSQH